MCKRVSVVTSPITVAVTSHFLQICIKRFNFAGSTIAHIRSWDSLINISSGERDGSRRGTVSRRISIPPLPAEASSDVAHESPAPPRSWIPTTKSSLKISKEHSIKTFSANGSPTWTAGLFVGFDSLNVSDARTETPPIPSPPVLAPNKTTRFPAPWAVASLISECFMTPIQSAFTNGFP